MKKVSIVFLALALALAACGGKKKGGTTAPKAGSGSAMMGSGSGDMGGGSAAGGGEGAPKE